MGLLETLTMQQKEMTIFKKILQPFTSQPACMHVCMFKKPKYVRNITYSLYVVYRKKNNLESSRNYNKSIQALKLFEILENYYFIVACFLIVIFSLQFKPRVTKNIEKVTQF